MRRLGGLESIRFLCAMWVVFAHMGKLPIHESLDLSTSLGWLVSTLYNLSINGRAAVMVFFVISGMCIHYPCAGGEKPDWRIYYLRRYMRIGLPLLGILYINNVFFGNQSSLFLQNTILWTLLAELIYYTIYPALLMAARRWGWERVIIASFIAAYGCVVAINPFPDGYTFYGPGFTWLIGLPCWILGCLLAEKIVQLPTDPPQQYSTGKIWSWRIGMWVLSCILLYLEVRTPVSEVYTLNFYAILISCWLYQEMIYYQTHLPWRWLENAGKFSYSLYLIHPVIHYRLYPLIFTSFTFPDAGYILNWTLRIGFTIFLAYVFYLLIEKPSHQLAQKFNPQKTPAPAAVLLPARQDNIGA